MKRTAAWVGAALVAACHSTTPLGAACDEIAVCPAGYYCDPTAHCAVGTAPSSDSGPKDLPTDAGPVDAGQFDAGQFDAGQFDAGQFDAGQLDAGQLDAGQLDAGQLDVGQSDAGPPSQCSDGELTNGRVADGGSVHCGPGQICSLTGECVAPDYTADLDAGTVKDNVTGLVWQQNASCTNGTCNQNDALGFCAGLPGNWRLPHLAELFSLVYTGAEPSIDGDFFSGTPADLFWTDDLYVSNANLAWCVYFTSGYSLDPSINLSGAIRCVK